LKDVVLQRDGQEAAVQAGDAVKAMKALLHSGDRDRIVRFAQASRSREIYLLAAQYLQASGSWLQDEATLKNIVTFLSKAKSPQHLAAFYETCAQAEIDECRDYVRAEAAMQVCIRVPLTRRPSLRTYAQYSKICIAYERSGNRMCSPIASS
jgi:hypothetical protein